MLCTIIIGRCSGSSVAARQFFVIDTVPLPATLLCALCCFIGRFAAGRPLCSLCFLVTAASPAAGAKFMNAPRRAFHLPNAAHASETLAGRPALPAAIPEVAPFVSCYCSRDR